MTYSQVYKFWEFDIIIIFLDLHTNTLDLK